jgi:anti-sigma factor RsiW
MDERSDHPGFEQLADYTDRRLQPLAVLQVSNHLAGCTRCQTEVDWLAATTAALAPDLWQEPSLDARAQARRLFRQAMVSSRARSTAKQRPAYGVSGWQLLWQQAVDSLGGSRPRPALRPALAVALAVLILFITVFSIRQWQRPGQPETAVASLIYGDVEIRRGNTWQPLAPSGASPTGQAVDLRSGDNVRTGAASGLALNFFEHSTITLGERTEIGVQQLTQQDRDFEVYLYQQVGRLEASVQPAAGDNVDFRVETPAVLIRVTGTRFIVVVAADGTTEVSVQEGTVSVTGASVSTTVGASQMVIAAPGQPPVTRTATPGATGTAEAATATAEATLSPTPTATVTPRPTRTPRATPTVPGTTATAPAGGSSGNIPTPTLQSTPSGQNVPGPTATPPSLPPPTWPPPTEEAPPEPEPTKKPLPTQAAPPAHGTLPPPSQGTPPGQTTPPNPPGQEP